MSSHEEIEYIKWPHAPAHLFIPNSTYIVTAGTYEKAPFFNSKAKLDFLLKTLFKETEYFGWRLQAWAIMANHYHFIAQAPEQASNLKKMIQAFHSMTALWLNREDKVSGRKVWYEYWDTCLTYEKSYLARLNYVHHNPVKHGLVENAKDYPWCSMAWFLRNTEAEFHRKVLEINIDKLKIRDDF